MNCYAIKHGKLPSAYSSPYSSPAWEIMRDQAEVKAIDYHDIGCFPVSTVAGPWVGFICTYWVPVFSRCRGRVHLVMRGIP